MNKELKKEKTVRNDERIKYILNMSRLAFNFGFVPIPLKNKFPVLPKWQTFRNNLEEDTRDIAAGKDPKSVRKIKHLAYATGANNISVLTGEASGIVVIDIDTEHDGVNEWNEMVQANSGQGGLPTTFTVQTPSGGFHYYFKYTSDLAKLGNVNRVYRKIIDFRTNGGMIVFPGSVSEEGIMYQVYDGYNEDDNSIIIAKMPSWVKKLLVMDKIIKTGKTKIKPNQTLNITEDMIQEKAKELGILV